MVAARAPCAPCGTLWARLQVVDGCSSSCSREYTAANAGTEDLLALSDTPSVAVLLTWTPAGTSTARALPKFRALETVSVELAVVTGATALLGILVAVASLLVTCVCVGCRWRCARRRAASRVPSWDENARLELPWLQAVLALAACCVLMGALWIVLDLVFCDPRSNDHVLLWMGIPVLGVGVLLLIGFGLWALYDPEEYLCPACGQPVNHWCVRACVRASVRVCVRACVRVCVRACVRACVCACVTSQRVLG